MLRVFFHSTQQCHNYYEKSLQLFSLNINSKLDGYYFLTTLKREHREI